MPIGGVISKARVPVKVWSDLNLIESQAIDQLVNTANLPYVYKHIAVMPDVHVGIGATVGSVIPTVGAIIPAAVGVDIGCGMMAVRTSVRAEHLPDSLAQCLRCSSRCQCMPMRSSMPLPAMSGAVPWIGS